MTAKSKGESSSNLPTRRPHGVLHAATTGDIIGNKAPPHSTVSNEEMRSWNEVHARDTRRLIAVFGGVDAALSRRLPETRPYGGSD